MEKLVYGLWRRPDQDLDALRAALLDVVAPRLLDLGVDGLRICVEEPAGKAYRVGRQPGRLAARGVGLPLDRQLRQPRPPRGGHRAGRRAGVRVDRRRVDRPGLRRAPHVARRRTLARPVDHHLLRQEGGGRRRDLLPDLARRAHAVQLRDPPLLAVRAQPDAAPDHARRRRACAASSTRRCPTDEDMLDFTRFFGCADDPRS